MRSTFPRSSVLVLGQNSVQSLVPSTLISQVESLLDSHRIQDAVHLADAQRKRIQAMISGDSDEAEELRYVYQRTGFQCFSETRFAEAFESFFHGELDPRLAISYFPELRGSLFTAEDSMDVFAGVAQRLPPEASVEDLIRNYSPHLSPNTRSAPSTVELRKVLVAEASEKLELFLRKWRERKNRQGQAVASSSAGVGGKPVDPALTVVDTVLVKLYASSENTQDLYALLGEPNHVFLPEVELVLRRMGQYNALCKLYRERGEEEKLLDLWVKLVEGEWTDDDVKDPLSEMISLLAAKRDRSLTQKWSLWMMKHDSERALKLLMPGPTGKRREKLSLDEDVTLLEQIKEADPVAGVQFLEYLVVQRRSLSHQLHNQLASSLVDQLCATLEDESVSKLWRAKSSSYASSSSSTSFLSYFASTTPDSPSKRLRIKTVLFLAGSSLYDTQSMKEKVMQHEKILRLEVAVLEAKSSNHRGCLSTLVHSLRDFVSAEVYCTLGGGAAAIVPLRVARALVEGERYLDGWAVALFESGGKTGKPPSLKAVEVVDEQTKRTLLKLLLEVYLADGDANKTSAAQAQALINSQAVNLDVLEVISLIPPNWPLNLTTSFLARSFRRTLHTQHEGKIVKAFSAGRNLEVKEQTWLILREEGMVIEEAAPEVEDDQDESVGGGGMSYESERGAALSEKEMMVRMEGRQAVRRDDLTVSEDEQQGYGSLT